MMKFYIRTAAALAVASTVLAFAGQSHATAFAAWQVTGVPFGDTLNVRKYPSGASQKQAAYPNGTVLQMTGKCTGCWKAWCSTTTPGPCALPPASAPASMRCS